jgi:hypothetical protein
VGLEEVEDESVALGERALTITPLERERLPVGRLRGDVYFKRLLDTNGAEVDVIETSSMQLAAGQEVRDPERAEFPLPATQTDRVLVQIDDAGNVGLVTVARPSDIEEVVRWHAIVLVVRDPVGRDYPSQLEK